MKVVRLTQHELQPKQDAELKRIFGEDVEIVQFDESLPTDSRKAVSRFDEITADADVAEAVLSVNLIEAMLKYSEFSRRGGQIIRSVMDRTQNAEGKVSFNFAHYEKVVKVETITERL